MTGIDHQHSALVEEAADHLSKFPVFPAPVIVYLKRMFPALTLPEACETIRLARLYQAGSAGA
jgi:hypothetical protein